jgi:hypothetical protein
LPAPACIYREISPRNWQETWHESWHEFLLTVKTLGEFTIKQSRENTPSATILHGAAKLGLRTAMRIWLKLPSRSRLLMAQNNAQEAR